VDLTHIYRVFYIIYPECTFFSAVHGTFSKIDYILGHKANLKKYNKVEIISYILSTHNGIEVEITSNRTYTKYTRTKRLKYC
jgi:hypothetical protein